VAVHALAGTQPIRHRADEHHVSRKFVYQQADKAQQALDEAFTLAPPDDDAVLFHLPVTETWLKRLSLALVLCCHSSLRGVYEVLRDVVHGPRSLGYLHTLAHTAMDRAHLLNQQQDLSDVRIGAHDEIFQHGQPVLVGVDVDSTYCYLLSLEEHRDGITWGVRLLELQDAGFWPQAIIQDGGSGLQAGQDLALPYLRRRRDVFHVEREFQSVVTILENRAYQALETCVQLERRPAPHEHRHGQRASRLSQKLRHARPAAAAAVALADDVATLFD
jgi:hypothetical protein